MSVLKRRSNNIKDGQYVIAFSDSRALIDITNNHKDIYKMKTSSK